MSKAIDELKHDHEAILFALQILEKMLAGIPANTASREDLSNFIGFLKEFADKCHHGKEEGLLFPALVQAGMPEKAGPVAVMLSEHVEGRQYIQQMEAALTGGLDGRRFTDAASGYIRLLRAHIDKENNVLFMMAEQMLPAAQLEQLHHAFEVHEENVIGHGRHEELHAMLKSLRKKYQV